MIKVPEFAPCHALLGQKLNSCIPQDTETSSWRSCKTVMGHMLYSSLPQIYRLFGRWKIAIKYLFNITVRINV